MTGGAGGVSLRAAGEQHAHVAKHNRGIIIPSDAILRILVLYSIAITKCKSCTLDFYHKGPDILVPDKEILVLVFSREGFIIFSSTKGL